MAYEISNYSVKVSLVAGGDLSSLQYRFVKLNSSGQVVTIAAATDRPIGVLQNAPASGGVAEVLVSGGTKLVLGGTVTEGGIVSPSSTGTAVAIVAGTDTTKYICGTALTEGASGEIITAVVALQSAGRAA
jgi:hypothetical protein